MLGMASTFSIPLYFSCFSGYKGLRGHFSHGVCTQLERNFSHRSQDRPARHTPQNTQTGLSRVPLVDETEELILPWLRCDIAF